MAAAARRPTERFEERAARQVIQQALAERVDRFEDGLADRQVDYVIRREGGEVAIEVVQDVHRKRHEQMRVMHDRPTAFDVATLKGRWAVNIDPHVRIDRLVPKLVPALERLQRELESGGVSNPSDPPDEIADLGATWVLWSKREGPGRVSLGMTPWSERREGPADFVERALAEADDVPLKLARHPAIERHAFLWVTFSSDSMHGYLENRPLPPAGRSPSLPAGVTHVWVGSLMSTAGVIAWFPDRGWWRTPWRWPSRPSSSENLADPWL